MRILAWFLVVLSVAGTLPAPVEPSLLQGPVEMPKVEANRVQEITFTAAKEHANPFNQLELDVEFTEPGGHKVRVPAFWAGGQTWRVRYASPHTGVHSYRSECSDATD